MLKVPGSGPIFLIQLWETGLRVQEENLSRLVCVFAELVSHPSRALKKRAAKPTRAATSAKFCVFSLVTSWPLLLAPEVAEMVARRLEERIRELISKGHPL